MSSSIEAEPFSRYEVVACGVAVTAVALVALAGIRASLPSQTPVDDPGRQTLGASMDEPRGASPPAEQSDIGSDPQPAAGDSGTGEPAMLRPSTTIEPQPVDTWPTPPSGPLDLLRVKDAARVQRKLIDAGFLSDVADGVWGPRSRQALREFRLANRLGAVGGWDEATGRALFASSSTGAVASNAAQPFGTAPDPPRQGARRTTLNRADATWIQTRLRDLGYFSSHVSGTWGTASRNALRDFRSMNGLGDDDRWDGDTEQRLLSRHAVRAGRTFIGGWTAEAGSCQAVGDHGAPLVIDSRGARTTDAACDFRSVQRAIEGKWRVTAVCSAGGRSWTAHIGLALVGTTLRWSSERGTATYTRCPASQTLAHQSRPGR